jgi:dipeptidyl aminopeptidase/acylaminoacyl peptidase
LFENGQIEMLPLAGGGEPKVVLRGGYRAQYLATQGDRGHLVYLRAGVLYGIGFDPVRAEVVGEPVQLIDDVKSIGTQFASSLALSAAGTLAYPNGRLPQTWTAAWHDGTRAEALALPAGAYYTPRVSPDGGRVVLAAESDRGQDIHVYDIVRGTLTRLTFNGEGNLWPAWAPDGEHVVFTSRNAQGGSLWWTRADGARAPVRLFGGANSIRQIDISPDGAHVGYTEQHPETGSDLWVLPLDLDDPNAPKVGTPRALRTTSANEGVPRFSPDGRWLAYLSDEIGPFHTWVEPFPGMSGGRWQVTADQDIGIPRWSQVAAELAIARPLPRDSVKIEYAVEGERFIVGRHVSTPGLPLQPAPTGFEMFDLAPDGKRFLILMSPPQPRLDRENVTFVVNFASELTRRVSQR